MARRKIYASQIQRKLDSLERERKQILHHLAIVEGKIATLNETINIMQEQSNVSEYSTDLFIYCTYKRRFKGKLRNMLFSILRQQSDRYFTLRELAELALKVDKQDISVTEGHKDSVRGALTFFMPKGIVERHEISPKEVKWKLIIH
ncbi:DNA repair ATPase [Pasteurella multocida]|uniref:DNA repair ATPase n=1 Tax=Pasteurella multocida TaxID=747 RepID=UPI0031834841